MLEPEEESAVYTETEVELLLTLTRQTSQRERWSIRVQELKRDLANAESIARQYAEDVERTNQERKKYEDARW